MNVWERTLWGILTAIFVVAVLGAGALAHAVYNEGVERDRARGRSSGAPWDAEREPEYGCWRPAPSYRGHEPPCEDAP